MKQPFYQQERYCQSYWQKRKTGMGWGEIDHQDKDFVNEAPKREECLLERGDEVKLSHGR